MKLVVQIPCFNEEETLADVIKGIPKVIEGISKISVQIIDDGSTDKTVAIAKQCGVDKIITNKNNKGLARSFQAGINQALEDGADIILNTDGDNQYDSSSIPLLVRPIVQGGADIVIGDRNPASNKEFSFLKRKLQKFGSLMVKNLSQVNVPDAVSGFRAYTREAAMTINVMTSFSYTTETLIHAGQLKLKVVSIPIKTNNVVRPSRLFTSTFSFVQKQTATVLRSYVLYRSLSAFILLGATLTAIGLLPIIRFLIFYFMGEGDGKIQSLIIGSAFLLAGYITLVLALLSDAVAVNRKLSETTLIRLRKMEERLAKSDVNRSR